MEDEDSRRDRRVDPEGATAQLDLSGEVPYTIEGWFLASKSGPLVGRATSSSDVEYLVEVYSTDGEDFVLMFTRGATYIVTGKVPFGNWYHFAASYDASLHTMSLYLNGNLQRAFVTRSPSVAPAAAATRIGFGAGSTFFHGYIQNVRFWSEALTPSVIRQWMYNQPVDAPNLLGSFELMVDPPVDSTDESTITLTGASIGSQVVTLDPGSLAAALGGLAAVNPVYLNQVPTEPIPPPAQLAVKPQPEPLGAGHREVSWEALRRRLPAATTPEEERALRGRFDAAFDEAQKRFAAHPPRSLGLPAGANTECTKWWVDFTWILTAGLFEAFGLPTIPGEAAIQMYNLIAQNPEALAAVEALVKEDITVNTAFGVIKIFYEQGLIWPAVQLILAGLTMLGALQLLKLIVLYATGVAEAAVLIEFIVWAGQLTYQASQYDNQCCGGECGCG
jgi:hypothetical protein